MKIIILLIIITSAYSHNYTGKCDIEYNNGKYYNCSNANIIDSNLKVGRLTNREDKCDRCNPGAKYALEYMDKKKRLEVCVLAEFQEDVSFKKDVEICGNLTIKGDIIGLNITICATEKVNTTNNNTKCFQDNCTKEEWCITPHCVIKKVINTTDIQCFQDNCTFEQWCITPHCAMVPIRGTICAIDNCTDVVLCNCSGCAEQYIYSRQNMYCSGNICNVSCDEQDISFGIMCDSTQGFNGIYSEDNTAFCSHSGGIINSVGTFCWKKGRYLNENLQESSIYEVNATCIDETSCIVGCPNNDIILGTGCSLDKGLILSLDSFTNFECRGSEPTNITINVLCISEEYVVNCSKTVISPRVVINVCAPRANNCSVSCDDDEYITPKTCFNNNISTEHLLKFNIVDNTLICVPTSNIPDNNLVVATAYCWSNNGTFAQEITTC